MSLSIEAIEKALIAWLRASTGLAADAVYLAHQNVVSRFPGPACVLTIGDIINPGSDDELKWDFDAARPPGQEIVYATSGWRVTTATISFFAHGTVGDSTARGLAIRAQAALRLPTQRANLNAAGVGVLDEGTIRWVPVVDSGQWHGQAVLEVRICVRTTASEATGYIETFEATGTVT